jgi:hypothetical protein
MPASLKHQGPHKEHEDGNNKTFRSVGIGGMSLFLLLQNRVSRSDRVRRKRVNARLRRAMGAMAILRTRSACAAPLHPYELIERWVSNPPSW